MMMETVHPEVVQQHEALRAKLRGAGLVAFSVRADGELMNGILQNEDWLAELLSASPAFRQELKKCAAAWSGEDEPTVVQAMPGLWLVPMPIVQRRRRVGYHVPVVPTEVFVNTEQFVLMCQTAQWDYELCRKKLEQLPPASTQDVERLACLVRTSFSDQINIASTTETIESVGKQLTELYEEMNLLYTITQNMTMQQGSERFVASACNELMNTMSYSWIGAQFVKDRERVKSLASQMIIAGEPKSSADELKEAACKLLSETEMTQPIIVGSSSDSNRVEYSTFGKTALIQPIAGDDQLLGVLIAGEKQGDDADPTSVDMKLLGATATHLSIFVKNAVLYDDLNAMFLGTLEALTSSIDAKDRYTCGHSRRVAHLTQELSRAVGLDDATVERMHIAGLVHDVGKIGVPEAVLTKPGKLTQEEFEWIRKHPEIGYRILRDIPQLDDVLPGVLYHHERWDGQGYPSGLEGEGIPLIARLICLADSFDAMSSTRTYRSAMSRPQVLEEINRCSGSQFDPSLVPYFLGLDFSEYDRLVRDHQARESQSNFGLEKAA